MSIGAVMERVTVFCFFASYLVSFGLELTRLLGRSALSRWVMIAFSVAGMVAHTAYLINRSRLTDLPPLLSSMHDWMLVLAWVLVTLYLVLSLADRDLAWGTFLLPVVILLVGSTWAMSVASTEPLNPHRGWRMLHATSLVFGMGGMVVAIVSAGMYLLQHRRLRTGGSDRTGWKLPSLERLARTNRWAIAATFVLLSVGFLTGFLLIMTAPSGPIVMRFTDPLVIVSLIAWVVFAAAFAFLVRPNATTGRQVAWLTLFGLGFWLATVVGLQIVSSRSGSPNWHSRISIPQRTQASLDIDPGSRHGGQPP
jgi:ABC-type uncharacterized transport system permease subunit